MRTRSGRFYNRTTSDNMANVPAAVVFALTPGELESDALINYASKEGIKAFNKATLALTEVFDGTSERVLVLQEELQRKSKDEGWCYNNAADVVNIAPDAAVPQTTKDIIQEYSQLTEARLNEWATATIVPQVGRVCQNNHNMYVTLVNSLSSDMKAVMALESESYTVGGQPIASLFYKALMSKAEVDTQATIAMTRTALTRLAEKMLELNSNVVAFNDNNKLND